MSNIEIVLILISIIIAFMVVAFIVFVIIYLFIGDKTLIGANIKVDYIFENNSDKSKGTKDE